MAFVINGLSSLIGNSDCLVVSIVKVNYTAVIVKANRYINIYIYFFFHRQYMECIVSFQVFIPIM